MRVLFCVGVALAALIGAGIGVFIQLQCLEKRHVQYTPYIYISWLLIAIGIAGSAVISLFAPSTLN